MNEKTSDSEELLQLAALGEKFKRAQTGKRPEAFRKYIKSLVENMQSTPSFNELLYQLELAAVRRRDTGEHGEPIEMVNHVWQVVVFHDKKNRRVYKAFGTVRNTLTRVKKELLTTAAKQ